MNIDETPLCDQDTDTNAAVEEASPSNASPFLTQVQIYVNEGHGQEALDLLDKCFASGDLDPTQVLVMLARADALRVVGKIAESSAQYRQAAMQGGEHTALVWRRDAECLMQGNMLAEAMESLRFSLSLNNEDVYAHYLLGQLLFSSTLQFSAVCHARHLLQGAQDDLMLATAENIYRFAMLPLEAYDVVKRRAELGDPGSFLGLLLCGAQGILDWDTANAYAHELETNYYAHGDYATSREIPLYNIARIADEATNLAVAREAVIQHIETAPAFDLTSHWKDHGTRIRVGLLSADFASHPVIQLIIGLFEHLDKERFELFAYDDGKNESHGESRLLHVVDKHVDVREQTDQTVAEKVHADGIDILIDLMGLTTKNRQGVLALRPCPVTATFLGFPGTSGLPSVDYVITDAVITPDSSKPHYAEKLCRLPETFMPNDMGRLIAANPVSRAELDLPDDKVVFCSFNRSFKLDKETVHLWMRILSRVPNSVLWQKADEANMKRVFLETAAQYGVAEDRIIFAGNTGSVSLHLARAGLADLGLDTLVYNGHTITADLLWAGVPVVTRHGTHFASRVSTSLLRAVGLPELAAPSVEAMEDMAVALALNPARLREIRQRLAENRGIMPLFDTERYTRHFETALTMMLDRAKEGLPADHIDVPALPPRTEAFLPDGPPREFDTLSGVPGKPYEDMAPTQALQKTPYGIHYGCCPACGGKKQYTGLPVYINNHPHWLPFMPEQVFWITCPYCGHAHTSAFWDDTTKTQIKKQAAVVPDAALVASARTGFGPVVRHLWQRMGGPTMPFHSPTLWLDVASDSGVWGLIASSLGFYVTSTDCPATVRQTLQDIGLSAWEENPIVCNLSDKTSVISLNNFENMPYPGLYLDWARERLEDDGALVFAYDEAQTPVANLVGMDEHSPLLTDPRRLHLFARKSLYSLLARHGFGVETVFTDPDSSLRLFVVAHKTTSPEGTNTEERP